MHNPIHSLAFWRHHVLPWLALLTLTSFLFYSFFVDYKPEVPGWGGPSSAPAATTKDHRVRDF